jgi:rod shape determining protein RodA
MSASAEHIDVTDVRISLVDWHNLWRVDRWLVLIVAALVCIGLLTLFSASKGIEPYYTKQATLVCIGVILAILVICCDHRFILVLAPIGYIVTIGVLLLVLAIGHEVKGGQRWLNFGPIGVQPSEFAKLTVIYALAWYFSTIKGRVRKLPFFVLALVITGIPTVLVAMQPSLGSALTLIPVVFAMLWAAGCKRWHLVAIVLAGMALVPVAWSFLEDYQKARVKTFLDPTADPTGKGWQTIQTKITVGSGQLTGKGYLQGEQTRLRYLPEHHTDFIFSLFAEEWGFFGALTLIALYMALLLRALQLARDCPEMSGSLVIVGVVALFAFHIFMNIAITIGLMPVTGMPLPFMSYGGSFCWATLLAVGMILHAHIRKGFMQ